MEPKYSRKQFDGYTHRFIVSFSYGKIVETSNMNIYSNSSSYMELHNFIEKNKSEKVFLFNIEHRSTKEADERISEFISDIFKEQNKIKTTWVIDQDGNRSTNNFYLQNIIDLFEEFKINNDELIKKIATQNIYDVIRAIDQLVLSNTEKASESLQKRHQELKNELLKRIVEIKNHK